MAVNSSESVRCSNAVCGHANVLGADFCARCGEPLPRLATQEAGMASSADAGKIPELPEDATPEQKDQHWYRYVYQGDRMPQLTLRAVLMGGVLGMLMAASNLYTTLAIGWGFGVAITSCVMSFVIWNAFRTLSGGALSPMSVLENNCMQSTASAAGYATGSTIATMFGALLLLSDPLPGQTSADVKTLAISPIWAVALFTLCTGLMGAFLAIPLKRQLINHEQLRFPSGIAAAETLRSLHGKGREALEKAYTLIGGIVAGAVVGIANTPKEVLAFLDRVLPWRLPDLMPEHGMGTVHGRQMPDFGFSPSLLLIAAGIITRMRVCLSMFIGAAVLHWMVIPWLVEKDIAIPNSGWVTAANGQAVYDKTHVGKDVVKNVDIRGDGILRVWTWLSGGTPQAVIMRGEGVLRVQTWSLWGGTAVMVLASLTSVAMQWRTIGRALSSIGKKRDSSSGTESAELRRLEVPLSWMIIGMVPVSIAMLFVQIVAFKIAWWSGLIAIAMSFVLSLVASRATGETDTTPVGAMGKVMQLLFAIFHPRQIVPNLASAGIAANSAIGSADLLTDLKSGYLLGANPRKQFLAQFFGVFFGTVAIVPIWFLMVPDRAHLEKFAAPATRTWEAVARVLTKGIDYLPVSAQYAMVIGALVGIALPLLERSTPSRYRKFLPSAMGLGLSWIVFFSNAVGFLVGAIIVWLWEMLSRRHSDKYAVPLASGMIAGESLIKAIIAMTATALGLMAQSKP